MLDFFIRFYSGSIALAPADWLEKKQRIGTSRKISGGFTLIEILVAMAILAMMSVFMLSVVNSAQNIWKQNASRTEEFRGARRAFERINERLSQATLNVYYDYVDSTGNPRMATNFSYTTGTFSPAKYFRLSELRYIQTCGTNTTFLGSGATTLKVVYAADPISGVQPYPRQFGPRGGTFVGQSVFFQAPIGSSTSTMNTGMGSLLNTVGFYIEAGSDLSLLPSTISTTGTRNRYRLYEMVEPTDNLTVYSKTSGSANFEGTSWLSTPMSTGANVTKSNASGTYTHRLADNVVALLFRADYTDSSGNPAQQHFYSSAPHRPLVSGTIQPIEENNLPPSVHVTMIAVDEISGKRIAALEAKNGKKPGQFLPDPQCDTTDPANPLDPSVTTGLPYFEAQLKLNGLNYIKFESTVKIGASKWSSK